MQKYGGFWAAAAAYILWGILPIYWKLLSAVPAFEILCHRMTWSLLLTCGLVFLLGRGKTFWKAIHQRSNLLTFTAAAVLLAVNWLLYIWAVNAGYIVEASLGYFINPLVNVLFGMIFFGERMRPLQWVAIALAFLGVLYLTFYYGQFPWIALTLALSFGTYGLLHKKSKLAALDALCLETGLLFVPAAGVLIGLEVLEISAFGHGGLTESLLLAGTGVVTTIPLLLFGYAAAKIPMSTLGLLQYMAPTINLLLGIFMYGEEFTAERMVGFLLIWSALGLYMLENVINRLRKEKNILAASSTN